MAKIDLTKSSQLTAPTALPLLIVIAGLQGFNIYYAFQAIFQKSNVGAIMPFISMAILSFISVLVIGILVSEATSDVGKQIIEPRSAIQAAELGKSKLKDLKDFLSSLLFVILASNGALALSLTITLFTSARPLLSQEMLFVFIFMLNIIYTCVTVNKCCLVYDSFVLVLRLV